MSGAEHKELLDMLNRATEFDSSDAGSSSPISTDADADCEPDVEIAELRAGWLGLSKLIENSEPHANPIDEVVERIVSECAIQTDELSRLNWASVEPYAKSESVEGLGAACCAVAPSALEHSTNAANLLEPAEEISRAGARWLSFSFLAGTLSASVLIAMAGTLAWSLLSHRNERQPERDPATIVQTPQPKSNPVPQPQLPHVIPPRNQFSRDGASPPNAQHLGPPREPATTSVDSLADDSRHGMTVDDEIAAVGQVTALVKHDWYVETTHVSAIQQSVSALEREMADDSL